MLSKNMSFCEGYYKLGLKKDLGYSMPALSGIVKTGAVIPIAEAYLQKKKHVFHAKSVLPCAACYASGS